MGVIPPPTLSIGQGDRSMVRANDTILPLLVRFSCSAGGPRPAILAMIAQTIVVQIRVTGVRLPIPIDDIAVLVGTLVISYARMRHVTRCDHICNWYNIVPKTQPI